MCKAELLNRYYVLSRTHCLADPISNNAHCEGSKDQCIKYQFFRPLHIFSVFQCSNHLDLPAKLIPVCGLLAVSMLFWEWEKWLRSMGSILQEFYPAPFQRNPLFGMLENYCIRKTNSGFHERFHLDCCFQQRPGVTALCKAMG